MNLQKLRLGQLKPADGATTRGDVYQPQTVLLAPFEGTNGSTSTSDSSTKNHSFSFSGSSLSISTSQSKFGSSSLFHNNQSSTADHVSLGTSSDFLINQNTEYTFEFWYRALDTTTPPVFSFGTYNSVIQYRITCTGDGNLAFKSGSGGWGWGSITIGGGTLTVDTWKHCAIVRNAGTLTLYVDGTSVASASTANWGGTSGTMRIGTYFGDARSGYFYMDDLRITKGIARYTGNFTPPTTAHLTSSGDANKQIVVNSGADGVAIGTGGINQARIAKAWCNFDGTGTPAIRASYNCSSITDIGTGKYKVNFSTGMTDEGNYVAFCAGAEVNSGSSQNHLFHLKRDSSVSNILNEDYVYVASANTAATQADDGLFCVLVFGN